MFENRGNKVHIIQHVRPFTYNYKINYTLVNSKQNKRLIKAIASSLEVGSRFPIPLMAIYKDGKLVKFYSKANQNGKVKYVNMKLDNEKYNIDGSSYQGKAPIDFMIGTWWNHSIVKASAQISAVSGRIIKQKVAFLGKVKITINGKEYDALHFNFSSTDKKLPKKKKLNTDIWYDEKTLLLLKVSYKKLGLWEYRLKNYE